MGLYQLAEIRWSGCGPHLVSQYSPQLICDASIENIVKNRPYRYYRYGFVLTIYISCFQYNDITLVQITYM